MGAGGGSVRLNCLYILEGRSILYGGSEASVVAEFSDFPICGFQDLEGEKGMGE